jgi:hypothetical protein
MNQRGVRAAAEKVYLEIYNDHSRDSAGVIDESVAWSDYVFPYGIL